MTGEQATQLQRDWLDACRSAGIPAITTDTSARIMAIVYVHGGGEEEMVLNRKFTNDVKYIQERFGIMGGETPDADFTQLLQHYVRQLEDYMHDHTNEKTAVPDWAHKLMTDRYGMQLHS
jgi:hypothetical protein